MNPFSFYFFKKMVKKNPLGKADLSKNAKEKCVSFDTKYESWGDSIYIQGNVLGIHHQDTFVIRQAFYLMYLWFICKKISFAISFVSLCPICICYNTKKKMSILSFLCLFLYFFVILIKVMKNKSTVHMILWQRRPNHGYKTWIKS